MWKSNIVKTILFSLILGVAINVNADWELNNQELKELPNQYTQAVKAAELNSFDKVKTIDTIAPWNSKLTFSPDGQKVLMTAIVPKWCIDSKIYVKSKTYTAPTWPVKILVDNHHRLVKETKIFKQEAYPLIKGKEWTGAWHERYDSSNKFKELRPILDVNYLTTHYNVKYAEKIKHLVNETEAKIVSIQHSAQGPKQDMVVLYEDLKTNGLIKEKFCNEILMSAKFSILKHSRKIFVSN